MAQRQFQDLVWSIQERPLIREAELWPSGQWFRELTVPNSIEIEPPPRYFRLGIHFEKLFQKWLEQSDSYRLLAANLQVQSAKRTLGEFDLLVNGPQGHEHWELAIKFYINIEEPEDESQWFGPDPSDSLATKLNRLTTHQLKLPETPEAQTLLKQKEIDLVTTRCIMKGRLYHPWQTFLTKNFAHPNSVDPNHLKGWWLAGTDLERLAEHKVAYLDKQYWLSNITTHDQPRVLTFSELQTFVRETEQIAPQFCLLNKEGNELSRGFVLKPDWFNQLPD